MRKLTTIIAFTAGAVFVPFVGYQDQPTEQAASLICWGDVEGPFEHCEFTELDCADMGMEDNSSTIDSGGRFDCDQIPASLAE